MANSILSHTHAVDAPTAKGDLNECAICFQDYEAEFKDALQLKTCGHVFHKECLLSWDGQSLRDPSGIPLTSCPMCREQISSGAVQEEDDGFFDAPESYGQPGVAAQWLAAGYQPSREEVLQHLFTMANGPSGQPQLPIAVWQDGQLQAIGHEAEEGDESGEGEGEGEGNYWQGEESGVEDEEEDQDREDSDLESELDGLVPTRGWLEDDLD
ncbi:MAG: hypothetical protein M1820_007990 [Bogoriella megaspora]|nr:MAG: hypothetical protein M1820_007990 [Bogoriella megaspora]